MQAQFDHLVETYFGGFDFDLGERELGYALSFDHDLDIFAASLGLIKTSIEAVMKEDGECLHHYCCPFRMLTLVIDIVLDMGDFDPAVSLFDPLQKVLDQCRNGKNYSK
jgi:dynactin 1